MLMAIYINGMTTDETVVLTQEMRDSGALLKWDNPTSLVDKHSTGGVGDKVSVALAPVLAACGLRVPMIAGRGLEHTGGTIDKLEAIPGYIVELGPAEIQRVVREVGCSISTQTKEMIPADRILYAMRDVTNTVASLPLIVSSILSKKLAEGVNSLLLDIKVGRAAFMRDVHSASELARQMVAVGTAMGVNTKAMLTSMDEPLGHMVCNALEVIECIEIMAGGGSTDLRELIVEQAAQLLMMSGVSSDIDSARLTARSSIEDGSSLSKFEEMIVAQGVDEKRAARLCSNPREILATAPLRTELLATKSGFVSNIDAMSIAKFIIQLGGGRIQRGAEIDHRVGIELHVARGDKISQGEPWATIHHIEQGERHDALEHTLEIVYENVEPIERILKLI